MCQKISCYRGKIYVQIIFSNQILGQAKSNIVQHGERERLEQGVLYIIINHSLVVELRTVYEGNDLV